MATIVGKDNSVAKRCTCRECASIVEYLPMEKVKYWSTDYTGGKDEYAYVVCPNCSTHINVSVY